MFRPAPPPSRVGYAPVRLAVGGFLHHYGFGPGMTAMTPAYRLIVDAAWRSLEHGAAWPASGSGMSTKQLVASTSRSRR